MRYRIRTEPDYRANPRYIAECRVRVLFFFHAWETIGRGESETEVQKAIDLDIALRSFKREIVKEIDHE